MRRSVNRTKTSAAALVRALLGMLVIAACAPAAAGGEPVDAFDTVAGEEWDSETPGDDAGGDATAPEEPVVTDPEIMDLKQLMRMQQYVYVATSGRDPFTFRIKEERQEETATTGTEEDEDAGVIEPPVDTGPDRPSERVQELELSKWYRRARGGVIAVGYEGALEVCDEAVDEIEEWGGVTSERAAVLYERLVSLRATAQRLANRDAVRQEFETLPIEVAGIRWGPRKAFAMANGVVVEPGQVISVPGPGGPALLQVEAVERDGVVFIYKGQRLRKGVIGEPVAP
ncbi:MAG: hypothetical protein ACOCX4_01540 [Planctomycetota bacterium]